MITACFYDIKSITQNTYGKIITISPTSVRCQEECNEVSHYRTPNPLRNQSSHAGPNQAACLDQLFYYSCSLVRHWSPSVSWMEYLDIAVCLVFALNTPGMLFPSIPVH